MRLRSPLLALVTAVFLASIVSPPAGAQTDEADANDTFRLLDLFGEVFERVRAQYVEEVSDRELIEAAINGMLTNLDPHSSYLNLDSFQDMQVQTRGAFGGLGIEVTMEDGLVKVVAPIDGTPADEAGLQAGDYISHLDGDPVLGLTLSEAVDLMRGPVGAAIDLTILREGLDPFDVTIIRDTIQIQSVRSRLEADDVGYLRISSFTQQTEGGLVDAIADIKAETDGNVIGYVLDLRNNPGGLLDQAIAVSDAFLEEGEIVSTRSRESDNDQRFFAREGDEIDGLPLVVLINGGSASASEIVAGALQDHGRAIIMGTESFGKGSVQTIIPLPGNGAMRLTTSRYYTPSGRSIQALGIEPDILVEPALIEEVSVELTREADLRDALEAESEDGDGDSTADPDAGGTVDDAPADYQLLRAVDLLQGIALYERRQG